MNETFLITMTPQQQNRHQEKIQPEKPAEEKPVIFAEGTRNDTARNRGKRKFSARDIKRPLQQIFPMKG